MAVPIPFLSDIDLNNGSVLNSVLESVKFGDEPTTPEKGHFYKKAGVLYYRNDSNVEIPVHENAIREIVDPEGILGVTIDGTKATVTLAPANGTKPGLITAEQYELLNKASAAGGYENLVLRDDNGIIRADELRADIEIRSGGNIIAGNGIVGKYLQINNPDSGLSSTLSPGVLTGLQAPPPNDGTNPNRGNYATNVDFLETSIAAVQNQVQNAFRDALAGLDAKESVRVVIDSDTPLTSTFGIFNGVEIANTDINKSILLINQTLPVENGAWLVSASGLTRREDSDTAADLTTGAFYRVEDGTYKNHAFSFITPNGYDFAADAKVFVDISGVNVIKPSNSIQIVDQVISITSSYDATVESRIQSAIAPLQDATEVSALISTAIAPLTDETEVNALIATALSNYSSISEFTQTLGDGTATSFTVTHNLNNNHPNVFGYYKNSSMGAVDFTITDNNNIIVNASLGGNPIEANSLRIVIQGFKFPEADN